MSLETTVRPVLVATLLVLLALPAPVAAQTADPAEVGLSAERLERINELVQRHLDTGSFSGAVTLVARQGRIAHLESHGQMDLATEKPMATDAVFRIMSMTKPVVGVSIMLMIEEGKVRLNDPASRFIPELEGLTVAVPRPASGRGSADGPQFYTVPADREVTVRDLLTHTSGMVSGTIGRSEAARVSAGPNDTLADYIPRLGSVPLEFQPGTRWAYSATAGLDTLARIVEITSRMDFNEFTRTRIFEPLGMNDTFFKPSEAPADRLTTLYGRTPTGLEEQGDPAFMNGVYFSGGGGLFSTAEDYVQFGQMLLNGGALDGKRILGTRTVESMRSVHAPDTLPGRPPGEGYGLSVRVVNDAIQRGSALSDGSFGWSGAFGTHFWVDPREEIVGILMTQTSNGEIRGDFEMAVMQAIVD